MGSGLLPRLLAVLIGYICGMFQSAYIIGRIKGVDIRDYGSGNSGTTNAVRVFGRLTGLYVFLLDVFKCVLAIVLTKYLIGRYCPDLVWVVKMYAFAGCVLGHDYPAYMKFKGGKGVAVTGGFVMAYHPVLFPIALLAFGIPYFITKYVSLGSLIMYTTVFLSILIMGVAGVFAPSTRGNIAEICIIFFILTAMVFIRHRSNIDRLRKGTENKTKLW